MEKAIQFLNKVFDNYSKLDWTRTTPDMGNTYEFEAKMAAGWTLYIAVDRENCEAYLNVRSSYKDGNVIKTITEKENKNVRNLYTYLLEDWIAKDDEKFWNNANQCLDFLISDRKNK